MPTSIQSFADAEVAVKWQEPYVSQGLNRGVGAHADRGIQRGFRLTTNISALTVTVQADAVSADHAALCRTAAGYGISLLKTGGNFSLNLTAFASTTVVIALYVTYSTAATTTATLRAYELLPVDEYTGAIEKDELIVLGVVKVPAAGVIAAVDITHDMRIEAWQGRNEQAVAPKPLLRNGDFEQAQVSNFGEFTALHWYRTGAASNEAWFVTDTDPPTGSSKHLSATYNATPVTSTMCQTLRIPTASGDVFRFRAKVKNLVVSTAGSLQVNLHYVDEDGTVVAASSVTIPTSAVDATYRQFDYRFTVPANARVVTQLELKLDGLTIAAPGSMVQLGAVEFWGETRSEQKVGEQHSMPHALTTLLGLLPDTAAGLGTEYATGLAQSLSMFVQSITPTVVRATRRDRSTTALPPELDWRGVMSVGTESGAVDARTPRVTFGTTGTGSCPLTLIWKAGLARVYVSAAGDQIYYTVNASADDNATLTWSKDTAGLAASKFMTGTVATISSLVFATRLAANDVAWADTAWDVVQDPAMTPLADLTALEAILVPTDGTVRHVLGQGIYVFKTSATTGISPFRIAAGDATPGGWVSSTAHETTRTVTIPLGRACILASTDFGALAAVALNYNIDFATATATQILQRSACFYTQVVDVTAENWQFLISLDDALVDGATIAEATLHCRPVNGHGALPTRQISMSLVRGSLSIVGSVPANPDLLKSGGGSGHVPLTAANVGAYHAAQALVYTPDQNHDNIDKSLYTYSAIIADEGGTNALSGAMFYKIDLSLTDIPDARR